MSQKSNLPTTSINLPWQDPNTKTGFSWTKYLETTRSKIAPSKIFDEMSRFPHSTNRFKVGMKLEAIDPEHPALFCVVTVVSIKGKLPQSVVGKVIVRFQANHYEIKFSKQSLF